MRLLHRAIGRHTRRRRGIQTGFLLAFAAISVFGLLRFDFPGRRLFVLREEVGLDEWALIWLFLMFAMWAIGAVSLVLGRVYCAYACPQMIFTEIAHDLDAVARRFLRRWAPPSVRAKARVLSLSGLLLVSIAASVLLLGYFAPLPAVVRQLRHPELGSWIGATFVLMVVVAFIDFAFVRERFCRSACPYGLLQGVIEDGRSLHIRLDERSGRCIDCGACVRVCPMAIDIRAGSFQIECTRCGSCVDSCDAVLGRLTPPRPGVLAFAFGTADARRWDSKRVLVAAATLAFGIALTVGVTQRETLMLQLSPLYESAVMLDSTATESRFLLRAANRGRQPVHLRVSVEGLPASARVEGVLDGQVPPGTERRFTLVARVPSADLTGDVVAFTWVVDAGGRNRRFDAALLVRERRIS